MTFLDDPLFEDVRVTEARAVKDHENRMAELQVALAAANNLLALEQSPVYQSFQKNIETMLAHRTEELLSVRSDREAAVLQGRCQELRAIVALTRGARHNADQLMRAIEAEEDRWRELEPKLRPQRPT